MLDGFSEGFNAICGDSDVGKTSVIRALRLPAYNQFSPKSVRIGCKNCRVKVTTERGSVTVTRGKDNIWDIEYADGHKEQFTNVGKSPVPQAQQIIGFRELELGDMRIKINMTDQLDGHFMIDELDGENASGSARAQIIDEISGLTGVETLIRNVSGDRLQSMKEIKKCETAIGNKTYRMHDPDKLEREERLLDEVGEAHRVAQEALVQADALFALGGTYKTARATRVASENSLTILPDTNEAEQDSVEAERFLGEVEGLESVAKRYACELTEARRCKKILRGLPSTDTIMTCSQLASDALVKVGHTKVLLDDYNTEREEVVSLTNFLETNDEELIALRQELEEVLASVTICPLNLRPINDECRKGIDDADKPSESA